MQSHDSNWTRYWAIEKLFFNCNSSIQIDLSIKYKAKSGKMSDSLYKDSKANPLRTIWVSTAPKKPRVRNRFSINNTTFFFAAFESNLGKF